MQQQSTPRKNRQPFRAGGRRQRFEIEHNRIVSLLVKSGDALDTESADSLVAMAVDKGVLCKLPKSTFYVLNDHAALEVREGILYWLHLHLCVCVCVCVFDFSCVGDLTFGIWYLAFGIWNWCKLQQWHAVACCSSDTYILELWLEAKLEDFQ